jgi:hypothetical protein
VLSAHRAAAGRHGEKAVADIMRDTAERIYRPA